MEFTANYITPDIKLSCYEDVFFKSEVLFEHHMLVWFIEGETKITQAGSTQMFKAGDIFLIPRNQLVSVINYPKNGKPHKSVVMHLTVERLREFYGGITPSVSPSVTQEIQRFEPHPLLQSCLASLIPYFDMANNFPERIAALKITEALTILRTLDASIDRVLANFSVPGKLDLERFMEQHFMFNQPLEKFGYLTGRSLSTFNRDFRKTFHLTPQKWLTKRRLQFAHQQIAEHQKKPVEIYLEAGFENLSHFSVAYKREFGFLPTSTLDRAGGLKPALPFP